MRSQRGDYPCPSSCFLLANQVGRSNKYARARLTRRNPNRSHFIEVVVTALTSKQANVVICGSTEKARSLLLWTGWLARGMNVAS